MKFLNVLYVVIIGIFFVACGVSDRAASTNKANDLNETGVLGVVYNPDADTDGDGLNDYEEVYLYHTAHDNNDTDGDGVLDGDEINRYHTNPINSDSDNDGLLDGDEINRYETNATNSDSDGDCLLDGFEILYYETNATNRDTDGDGRDDGIEIYSYILLESNLTCIHNPETLEGGYNPHPAIDNRPNDGTDVINALDPNLVGDSDGDGIVDDEEIKYGTNPDNNDTDGDGISDGDEINRYHTNPTETDSDNDGLLDGDEINRYETNATNNDTDNDGLLDGLEINTYHTNATNADTDGDCLLDSFEILNYETNASSSDTDKDGVEDGLEVYGDLDTRCISSPETLEGGVNDAPAEDNLTNPDVIDALDPFNDSDGDGQVNVKELECREGNPKDESKFCPFVTDTPKGQSLISAGFVYVPGGFDVDGDGVNEKGFWVSSYQARAKPDIEISSGEVNELVGKFNSYIRKNFFMVNATDIISPIIHGYSDDFLSDTLQNEPVPIGKELEFNINLNPQNKRRVSGIMPFMAIVSLARYNVYDNAENALGLNLTLPSLKQYAQIQQLLEADKKNGGGGYTIHNSLLGVDTNVPLLKYSKIMHEFGEGYKEYLNSIMQMKEGTLILCTGCPWVKPWMGIKKERLVKNPNEVAQDGSPVAKGADSNINVGMGVGSKVDDYGVLIRAGEVLDLTIGVAGATSDQFGTHDGVGFRAATPYLQ